MRFARFTLTIFISVSVCLTAASPTIGQPAKEAAKETPKVTAEEIDRLIEQLGDKAFIKREKARTRLEAIGEPAVGPLKKAIEATDNLEVRNAARMILEAYETKTSPLIHTFTGHTHRVNGVALSPDGKRALSGSWDGSLRYWNIETKKLIRQLVGHEGSVMGVAISPDGKFALSGSGDNTMRLWNLESGAEIRQFRGHGGTVWDVVFSPDGKRVLSGCSDGKSRLWEVETGKELLAVQTQKAGMAWTIAFTGDGKQAVAGGGDLLVGNKGLPPALRLWDLTTGQEVRQFLGHTKDIRNVAVSPNGKLLLSASFDGSLRLWDIESGKELRKFDGPGNFVEAVRFTPDGKSAVCSYGPQVAEKIYEEDPRCSVRLWDLTTGKELRQFKGHDGPVLAVAVSTDGSLLASGSADGTMRVWRLK